MVETKIRPIPPGDGSSFIIHDNSSEIAKFIPEKYIEPLVIVARIQGFDGIADYIIHLIKDRLEMFAEDNSSHHDNDLDNSFQQYMYDMITGKKDVPNTWTPNHRRRDDPTKTTRKESEEERTDDDDDTTTETEKTTGVTENTNDEDDEEEEEDSK